MQKSDLKNSINHLVAGFAPIACCATVLLSACGGGGGGSSQAAGAVGASKPDALQRQAVVLTPEEVRDRETDVPAPVDRGDVLPRARRGVFHPEEIARERALEADLPAPVDRGEASAPGTEAGAPASTGRWSAPTGWPINAIHAVLTPDGKVLTYGSDPSGAQGAQLYFDVWDPATDTHNLMQHATRSDMSCSAHTVLAESGRVLIAGGDSRGSSADKVNFGIRETSLYDPVSATMSAGPPMNHARWCGSAVPLADGRVLMLGGIDGNGVLAGGLETYTPGLGWKDLPGIVWPGDIFYPRAVLAPNGRVVVADNNRLLSVHTAAPGISQIGALPKTVDWLLPWAMFDRGRMMMIANDGATMVVDLNGRTPVVTTLPGPGVDRDWGSATVLPDGKVLVTGGSGRPNELVGAAFRAHIWDPKTGLWTAGASAQKPRLYHSTALLLPDATVLTAGGGSPGPVTNLNAEIYAPPYLFDSGGQRAPRPVIDAAPAQLTLGTDFRIGVASSRPVQRVTLVRTGSATHSTNFEQRFLELPFTQAPGASTIDVALTESPNVLPAGHYMLFVIDDAGVPSVARIVKLSGAWTQVAAQGQTFTLPSATLVRYGANEDMVEKTVSGEVRCTSAFFGSNPAPAASKGCSVLTPKIAGAIPGPATGPTTDSTVAVEGGTFSMPSPTVVSYGAGSSWIERTVSGPATCSNAFFGADPLRFVVKSCVTSPG